MNKWNKEEKTTINSKNVKLQMMQKWKNARGIQFVHSQSNLKSVFSGSLLVRSDFFFLYFILFKVEQCKKENVEIDAFWMLSSFPIRYFGE